jgi:PEP-CTERM motif
VVSTFLGESQALTVEGDFTMNSGTTLEFDIVSPNILDQLVVNGQFKADGVLQVTLLDGAPAPKLGDMFDILDFGSSSGAFDAYQLPGLTTGLAWSVANLPTTGELEVVQDVDLDDDGDVDGDDFLIIQRTNPSLIPAWNALYNSQIFTPLVVASTSVPEPASLLLFVIGGCGLLVGRRRHC